MSDFFREVDEELRRDRAKEFWDKYGTWMILAAVAVVGGTAAFRGYDWYQQREAANAGAEYYEAYTNVAENPAAALPELAEVAASGTSFAGLAQLRRAGALVEADRKSEALAAFDQAADDTGLPEVLRQVAEIRAGYLAVDLENYEAVQARVEGMSGGTDPFRHAAREILALSAYRSGSYQASSEWFDALTSDAAAPRDMIARAEIVQALLTARLGGQAAGEE